MRVITTLDAQEVREMTRLAALDAPVTNAPAVPVIDPRSLTRAQQAGLRCAVPNCRRLLADLGYLVGRLPGGKPVVACEDCAATIRFERSEEAALAA
jgi:hypothetical protein